MSDEKTEEPTERRLEKAREDGQLPQRKNVLEALTLTLGVGAVIALVRPVAEISAKVFDAAIDGVTLSHEVAGRGMAEALKPVLSLVLVVAAVLGAVILLVNLMLTRFNFSLKTLEPKLSKLNPANGFKQMFSVAILYNFGRLLTYFIIASLTLWVLVTASMGDAINAAYCGLTCLAAVFPPLFLKAAAILLLALLVMAAVDYKIQDILWRKQLRMSLEDIKREHKSSEGDPRMKGARKSIARSEASMPGLREVTHVVHSQSTMVALVYTPGQVPFVAARMTGPEVGKTVRKYRMSGAKCVNLPIVARDFYAMAPPGSYLPARSAKGMSQVLRETGEA